MALQASLAKTPMVVPTDAQLEAIGRSLIPKDIPAKLRCGICDLIAYNAIRLPCCSTSICENCFKTEIPEDSDECMLCHHSPLDKSICAPNKSMRITVRAHLKNKFDTRSKREAAEAAKVAKEEEKVTTSIDITQTGTPTAVSDVREESSKTHEQSRESQADAGPATENAALISSPKLEGLDQYHAEAQLDANNYNMPEGNTSFQLVDDDQKPQEARIANRESHKEAQANRMQPGNQWEAPSQANQGFNMGMNGINGMLPMDMTAMMAGGMMPMGGFQNVLGMGMMPQMMSQMLGGLDGSNLGMNINGMNMNPMSMGMGMGMGPNTQNQYGGNWMAGQNSYNHAYGGGAYGNQGGYKMSGNYNINDQYQNNEFQRGYGRQGYQNRRGRRGYYNGGSSRNNYNQSYQGPQDGFTNQQGAASQPYRSQSFERPSTGNVEVTSNEQSTRGISAEEAEAQILKELAPGGEHDFDEELGRKPSIDGNVKEVPDREDNAETSISSDSKETLPTEASAEEAPQAADDPAEKSGSEEKPTLGNRPDEEECPPPTETLTASPVAAAVSQQEQAIQDVEGAHDATKPSPQPIQTFISDEPRSRNTMPPPRSGNSTSQALEYPPDNSRYYRGDRTPILNSHTPNIIDSEPKGLGVVGAPTGPRALRQGQSNVIRNGWDSYDRGPTSEPDNNNSRGRSTSRTPDYHRPRSNSRLRSRSPVQYHSDPHRNRRHRSPSVASEARRERREEKRDEQREERRHRHSHRHHEDDDYEASDTRRSSHRAHRRHGKDVEQSDRRRHHDRSRSRSPDRERDRDLISEREKHRYREDDYEEDKRRHRKHARSNEHSTVHTPITPHAPELSNGYEEHSSRKRRSRDYDEDAEPELLERKRSRRESAIGYGRASERYSTAHVPSKPPTPVTSSFSGPSSSSRRGSAVISSVAQTQLPVIKKPIPTGPRAAKQQVKTDLRATERVVQRGIPKTQTQARAQVTASASAPKPEKDIHTLEREARDRERLQREMQRRAFGASKRKDSGNKMQPGRRVSYKYEDEGGSDARRIEQEREASRWA